MSAAPGTAGTAAGSAQPQPNRPMISSSGTGRPSVSFNVRASAGGRRRLVAPEGSAGVFEKAAGAGSETMVFNAALAADTPTSASSPAYSSSVSCTAAVLPSAGASSIVSPPSYPRNATASPRQRSDVAHLPCLSYWERMAAAAAVGAKPDASIVQGLTALRDLATGAAGCRLPESDTELAERRALVTRGEGQVRRVAADLLMARIGEIAARALATIVALPAEPASTGPLREHVASIEWLLRCGCLGPYQTQLAVDSLAQEVAVELRRCCLGSHAAAEAGTSAALATPAAQAAASSPSLLVALAKAASLALRVFEDIARQTPAPELASGPIRAHWEDVGHILGTCARWGRIAGPVAAADPCFRPLPALSDANPHVWARLAALRSEQLAASAAALSDMDPDAEHASRRVFYVAFTRGLGRQTRRHEEHGEKTNEKNKTKKKEEEEEELGVVLPAVVRPPAVLELFGGARSGPASAAADTAAALAADQQIQSLRAGPRQLSLFADDGGWRLGNLCPPRTALLAACSLYGLLAQEQARAPTRGPPLAHRLGLQSPDSVTEGAPSSPATGGAQAEAFQRILGTLGGLGDPADDDVAIAQDTVCMVEASALSWLSAASRRALLLVRVAEAATASTTGGGVVAQGATAADAPSLDKHMALLTDCCALFVDASRVLGALSRLRATASWAETTTRAGGEDAVRGLRVLRGKLCLTVVRGATVCGGGGVAIAVRALDAISAALRASIPDNNGVGDGVGVSRAACLLFRSAVEGAVVAPPLQDGASQDAATGALRRTVEGGLRRLGAAQPEATTAVLLRGVGRARDRAVVL